MREQKKQILLPKLRFPEFREAGEWEEKKLREVCNINPSNEGLPESFVYIDLESVVDGRLTCKKRINRDSAPSRAQRLLTNGDVIYQIVRPYQRNNLFCNFDDQQSYVASTGYAQLRSRGSSNYLYQLIHTDTFVNKVVAKCTGSNYPAINSSDLAEIEVVAPNAQEQQKIADCLSSIDELITTEAQKLDTLKAHKKGLMQQLFPAEGETLPKLRFPEFRDAREWEEKRLGDVCEKIMDGTHFSPKSKFGPRLYLTSKNIQNGAIDLSNTSYISEEEHRQIYERCSVKKNDVLLTKDGANTGNCALNNLDFEFSLLSSVAVLRGNPLHLDQKFLYQLVLADRTQKAIRESMSGQAITRITLEKIGNYSIPITSIAEQQKIADCLSSIDDLITAQTKKLATLKAHKKGLMQQLFPSLGGVDGEAGRGGRPVVDEAQG
ncbi:MAG: restriction endonuclease subunit S [Nitrosomonas sp.]|nr:restriction endonuclease subunit S [Nitrosomonas sp.]